MVFTTTLTQKGQVTIPINIRKMLDLKPYEKVAFEVKKEKVTLKKAPDFLSLRGSIKSKKKYSDEELDEVIGKAIAKEYEEESKSY